MATPAGNGTQAAAPKEISSNITAREQLITIPAKTLVDLEFLNTSPNYVYVNNYSSGTLYFGRSVLPTAFVYDMVIEGNADNLYSSPNGFRAAYIYNDGADVVNCKITSFVAPFEPTALKGGGGTATFTGTIGDVNSTITGFNVPLPSGNNHVGVVTVDSMPAQTLSIPTLPAGTNNIGHVNVDTLPALPAGVSHIGSVGIDGGVSITSMPPVQVSNSPIKTTHQYFEGTVAQTVVTFDLGAGNTVNNIDYIKNDGSTDLYLTFDTTDITLAGNQTNGLNMRIRLAAGEAISDMPRQTNKFNMIRTTGSGTVRILAV